MDTSVALWFKAHRTSSEIHWASIISSATKPVIVGFVACILLLYWIYRSRLWHIRAFVPLAIIVTCGVAATIAKPLFDRVRPGMGLSTAVDLEPSYPSSHTVFIAAVGGSLLFIFVKRRVLIAIATVILTAFIGLDRLVLGVHWFTDILGAALLSLGIVLVYFFVDDWLRERENASL